MRQKSTQEINAAHQVEEKHFDDLKEVRRTVDFVRMFIGFVGLLLGGTFTFAKLSGLPVIQISSDDWSRFFMQAALIVYFWGWILGSKSDLNAQERAVRVLLVPKTRIYSLLGWCVGLVAVFVVLWRITTFTVFSLALIGFLLLDLLLYYFFYNRVLKIQFLALRKQFLEKRNPMSALEVEIVDEFMKGKWRYWRWGFGFAWIITFLFIDLLGGAEKLAGFTGILSSSSLLAFSVLVLVIIMEAWIWAFRLRRQGQDMLLGGLRSKFDLNFKKHL
ncbi:MAG: hypothetical protein ACKVQW_15315 [Pyrinomonadaceae bacterium]